MKLSLSEIFFAIIKEHGYSDKETVDVIKVLVDNLLNIKALKEVKDYVDKEYLLEQKDVS